MSLRQTFVYLVTLAGTITAGFVFAGKPLAAVSRTGVSAAQPDDGMKRLVEAFSGKWRIHVVDEPISATDSKSEKDGVENWRIEPGGVPFVEEFHATSIGASPDKTAYDNAYFWKDATTGKIHGLWCASFNEESCSPLGVTWEGETIVMNGEFVAGGKRFAWVEKYSFDGRDRFTQTLDQALSGEKLVRGTTIHAMRLK